ncbi:EF-hand domain-containing protein [Aurantimonas sp. VKM B-3413]|uniref:EF-hand domain-containing protein n=1 Tax=Aurantimonas sp. VKM B-3413 TaxID=2779401 RepID=UPI001E58A644|nr:EF-hand domain-containing protein [Aurantimonas sp. VKM B-3413]MCB8840259.1 EF-hand domain-containing protein [Aurantimonas sp. VKM B-3413]
MKKLSILALSAAVLAGGLVAAHAQQGQMMGGTGGPNAQNQDGRPYGRMPWGGRWGMGPGMMGDDDWGPGMMGPGMMMGRGMMGPQMMIIMMDTNSDGKLSLDEFQSMHKRMFDYLDANGDGQIEMDELGPRSSRNADDK